MNNQPNQIYLRQVALLGAILIIILLSSCVTIESIDQPSQSEANQPITSQVVVSVSGGEGQAYFGVHLPAGWIVTPPITYAGGHTGTLTYSSTLATQMAAFESAPDYHWWAGVSPTHSTNNLTTTITLNLQTDQQPGIYYLDYMLGSSATRLDDDFQTNLPLTITAHAGAGWSPAYANTYIISGTTSYSLPLSVVNVGPTGTDTFTLSAQPPSGWTASFYNAGPITHTGPLSASQGLPLSLQLTIPSTATLGTHPFSIQATSANDPAITTLKYVNPFLIEGKGYLVDSDGYARSPVIRVIDPGTHTILETIDHSVYDSSSPQVNLTPDGTQLYLAFHNALVILDAQTHQPIGPAIPLSQLPKRVAFSCDGSQALLISDAGYSDYVTLFDTTSLTVTQVISPPVPSLSEIDPHSCFDQVALLTSYGTDSVIFVDTQLLTTTKVIADIEEPADILIAPDRQRAYISNDDASVTVINIPEQTIHETWHFNLANEVRQMAISPDGRKLYVSANFYDSALAARYDGVLVVDTMTGQVINKISLVKDYFGYYDNYAINDIALSADGRKLFTVHRSSSIYVTSFVTIVDTTTQQIIETIIDDRRYPTYFTLYPPTHPPQAGLTINKSTTPETVTFPNPFTYTVTYAYTGTNALANAAILDILPENTTYLSATGGLSHTLTNNRLVWNLGTLTSGDQGQVAVVVQNSHIVADTTLIQNTAYGGPLGQFSTALVTITNPTLGVALTPETNASVAAPDFTAIHSIDLYNAGSTPDNYTLSIVDAAPGWSYTIYNGSSPINSTGMVGAYAKLPLSIWVHTPHSASYGDEDQIILRATSTTNPAVMDDTVLTTRVIRPGYALFAGQDKITVLDTWANTNTGMDITLESPGNVQYPWDGAISPSGELLYVSLSSEYAVMAIDATTNTPILPIIPRSRRSIPERIAFTCDEAYALSAGHEDDRVAIIDTDTHTITNIIHNVDDYFTMDFAPNPCQRNLVYTVNDHSNSLNVIDTHTMTITPILDSLDYPRQVEISPDGNTLYVSNDTTLFKIDPATKSIINTVAFTEINDIVLDPGQNLLYALTQTDDEDQISVISTISLAVLKTIPIPGWSNSIALSPDGQFVYVEHYDLSQLLVLDTTTGATVDTINFTGYPRNLALFPQSCTCLSNSITNLFLPILLKETANR